LVAKYYSGNQIKNTDMGRACSTNGESGGAHRVLVGKPVGMRPLVIPRRTWEDNSKMGLREMGWGHGPDRDR
jgi:hypothetical protein